MASILPTKAAESADRRLLERRGTFLHSNRAEDDQEDAAVGGGGGGEAGGGQHHHQHQHRRVHFSSAGGERQEQEYSSDHQANNDNGSSGGGNDMGGPPGDNSNLERSYLPTALEDRPMADGYHGHGGCCDASSILSLEDESVSVLSQGSKGSWLSRNTRGSLGSRGSKGSVGSVGSRSSRSSRGSKRSHESIRAAKYTAAISETVDVLDAIEIMELEDRSSHNGSSNNSGSHDGGGKDEIDDILAAMDDVTAFDIDEAIDQVLSGKGAGVPGQGRGEASPKVRDGGAREEEEEEEEGDDESNGISSNGISSFTESHCPEAGEEPSDDAEGLDAGSGRDVMDLVLSGIGDPVAPGDGYDEDLLDEALQADGYDDRTVLTSGSGNAIRKRHQHQGVVRDAEEAGREEEDQASVRSNVTGFISSGEAPLNDVPPEGGHPRPYHDLHRPLLAAAAPAQVPLKAAKAARGRDEDEVLDEAMLNDPSFLHRACLERTVALSRIERLLEARPDAASSLSDAYCPKGETRAYPLHLACYNEGCPSSVIELLVRKNPEALGHLCIVEVGVRGDEVYGDEYAEGLPLHYYLSRESNRDLKTVRMLVEACPSAVTTAGDESRFTPLHTLVCNPNPCEMLGIAELLARTEPSALRLTDRNDQVPLHIACSNRNMTPEVIRLLLEVWPQSFAQRDNCGGLPLHTLCYANVGLEESVSMEMLKLLVGVSPVSVTHADGDGDSPMHIAADNKSPEFCKILVDAWGPELVKFESDDGILPVHKACGYGRPDTVEYLLDLYPEGISRRTNAGFLPVHEAAYRVEGSKAEIVEHLLGRDADCASRTTGEGERYPLHLACDSEDVDLRAVRLLYDAHPEAVTKRDGEGRTPLEVAQSQQWDPEVATPAVEFLRAQAAVALEARDPAALARPDADGRLPLHRELLRGAPLGAIKLLVAGHPGSLGAGDRDGALPLHVACENCPVPVVEHLWGRRSDARGGPSPKDSQGNSLLHYACRGGNLEVVRYLLGRGQVLSVTERNAEDKLPVHLLCEAGMDREVCSTRRDGVQWQMWRGGMVDADGPEYVEAIWRLLLAYPGTMME